VDTENYLRLETTELLAQELVQAAIAFVFK